MQRARKEEDKAQRASSILSAGLQLFRERGFGGFTMAEVATAAGLAKGTVFLYFPTREALGLALTEQLLGEWFDALEAALAKSKPPLDAARFATLVTRTLDERGELVALLAVLNPLLEHNIDEANARRFKTWLVTRMATAGENVERVLPWLGQGGGMRLMLHLDAMVVGLHQYANPAPLISNLIDATPQLRPLRIDFGRELQFGLTALLQGLQLQQQTKGRK